MEHVNNDMDDLFRKAGDLYPLKTLDSDWDKVFGNLQKENTPAPVLSETKTVKNSRFRRRWLLLLLLIPAGLGTMLLYEKNNNQLNTSADSKNTSGAQTKVHNESLTDVEKLTQVEKGKMFQSEKGNEIKSVSKTKFYNEKTENTGLRHNKASAETSNTLTIVTEKKYPDPAMKMLLPVAVSTTGPYPLHFVLSSKSATQDSLKADLKKNINVKTQKGFYAGLIAGPDLSTIKFQPVKQMGFTLGLVMGYRFSRKFSAESGLYWDKKYYYSKGEYFDKSKTSMPSTESVLNLDGYCNMFEVPLNLKYDFGKQDNHHFFVKTGVSAYFMKKEMYNINAKNNGMNVSYPATYNNTSNTLLAIAQLGAGYEHAIGKNTQIRIEPYLKIPLQKVGIGSMPISSAGFYLGITHNFR